MMVADTGSADTDMDVLGINTSMHIVTADDIGDDLAMYVHEDEDLGLSFFHHPLFIAPLPTLLPATIDEFIAKKLMMTQAFRAHGDWVHFVCLHERPYRMHALLDISTEKRGGWTKREAVRWWKLAARVWTDAEHDELDQIWSDVMRSSVPHPSAMTASSDRRRLREWANNSTPGQTLTLYRGIQAGDANEAKGVALGGWSWTLSRDVAAWFAWRWLKERQLDQDGLKPFVARAAVPITFVEALISNRGEEEVLISPNSPIGDLDIEPAGPRPAKSSVT